MKNDNPAERVHHPYSPSTLQAREGCAKFQPDHSAPVHETAEIGTRQHNAVETQTDDPKLLDYRAAAVVDCIKFAEERFKAFPGGTMLKEAYLPVDDEHILNPDWVTWQQNPKALKKDEPRRLFLGTTAGFADVAIVSKDETEGEVIDWKFGRNAVEEASNNLQGISYGL